MLTTRTDNMKFNAGMLRATGRNKRVRQKNTRKN